MRSLCLRFQLGYRDDVYPIDVILDRERAIVVGRGGLYRYDYRDLENLQLISVIPVR